MFLILCLTICKFWLCSLTGSPVTTWSITICYVGPVRGVCAYCGAFGGCVAFFAFNDMFSILSLTIWNFSSCSLTRRPVTTLFVAMCYVGPMWGFCDSCEGFWGLFCNFILQGYVFKAIPNYLQFLATFSNRASRDYAVVAKRYVSPVRGVCASCRGVCGLFFHLFLQRDVFNPKSNYLKFWVMFSNRASCDYAISGYCDTPPN